MHLADDRRDVVLAMRFETDVLQRDDFVVTIGFLKGALQQRYRIHAIPAEELLVRAHDAVGSVEQPFTARIVAGPAQQGANRVQGFLAGRLPRRDGLERLFGSGHGRGESSRHQCFSCLWGLQLLVGKAHRRERDAKRPAMRSVEPDRLMGAVERERGNADREAVAASRFHLIRPHHDP